MENDTPSINKTPKTRARLKPRGPNITGIHFSGVPVILVIRLAWVTSRSGISVCNKCVSFPHRADRKQVPVMSWNRC